MDSCGPQGTDLNEPRGQVTISALPSNFTALHQPMDIRIISSWKFRYCSLLIRSIVKEFETQQKRRDDSEALKQGMRKLAEGHEPHLLEGAKMVERSWAEVTDMTICRCW